MKLQVPTSWTEPLANYASYLRAAGQAETTLQRRLSDISQIARAIGHDGPDTITGGLLIEWAGDQDWLTETRRGRRASARSFWKWACQTGVCTEDAAEAWPYVAPGQPRPRPAPDRIYRAALDAAGARERLMLRLGAELGMRRAEVAVAHVGRDLSEDDEGWWLVVHGKGNQLRTMPVPDDLARLIRAGAPGHSPGLGHSRTGYLFPGAIDGHLSPRRVGEICGELLQAQQEEDEDPWTMHKLRHRFGSRALKNSRDIRAVQEALGHRSVATTQIYCATDRAAVRKAVAAAA